MSIFRLDTFLRPSTLRRWFAVLLVGIGLFAWPGEPASAHANLVRSEPAAGAVLAQAPDELVLEFSEDLDPGFSSVKLLDATMVMVAEGPGVIDPTTPRVLRLALERLPNGTYSAVWKARSAVDGHITHGSVGFSVGVSSPPASLLPLPGTSDPATALPTPADTWWRWLSYLTSAMTVGSLLFGLLVWRPALQDSPEAASSSDTHATRLLQRLTLFGIGGLIVATVGFAVLQAIQAAESFQEALSALLMELLVGRAGLLIEIRLGLLVGLALLVARLPAAGRGPAGLWWVAAGLGLGMLLTFSLQSHGAALGSTLATILDWLHLVAMAAWLGGLLPLAFLLGSVPQRDAERTVLTKLVPRFSRVALVSVATLTLTGLYSALLHVRSLEALTATRYGQVLSLKSGFFAVLLGLGAVNLLALSPRLHQARSATVYWLRRTVRAELLIGLLVLLAAGVLTGVAPAFEALEAQRRQGWLETAQVDDVQMVLRVAPAQVGENEVGIDLVDQRPGAAKVEPQVLLRLTMTGMDMGTTQVEALPQAGGRYTARGSYFTMAGLWQVEVILRRAGFNDVRQVFDLPIGIQTTGS